MGSEEVLEYEGEFRKELAQFVAAGKLPPYGVVLSSEDEDEAIWLSILPQFGIKAPRLN